MISQVEPWYFEMRSKGDCAYCRKWLEEGEARKRIIVSDMIGLVVCAAHYAEGVKSCADYAERQRDAIERMSPIQQEVVLALQGPFGFRRDGKTVEEGWYLSEKYDEKFFFKLEDGEWAVQIVKNAELCGSYPCGVYFYPMRLQELLKDGRRPASLAKEAVEALLAELDPSRIVVSAPAVADKEESKEEKEKEKRVAVADASTVEFWNDLRLKQYGALFCASCGYNYRELDGIDMHPSLRDTAKYYPSCDSLLLTRKVRKLHPSDGHIYSRITGRWIREPCGSCSPAFVKKLGDNLRAWQMHEDVEKSYQKGIRDYRNDSRDPWGRYY